MFTSGSDNRREGNQFAGVNGGAASSRAWQRRQRADGCIHTCRYKFAYTSYCFAGIEDSVNTSVSKTGSTRWNFCEKLRFGRTPDDDLLTRPLVENEVVGGRANGENFLDTKLRAPKIGDCAHPSDTAVLFHFKDIKRI